VVRPRMRLLEDAENDLQELKVKKNANDIRRKGICHK
jgi:hypothetical protein